MTATRPVTESAVAARPLVRPWWRRARAWLALLAVLVVAGAVTAAVSGTPARSLDPDSKAPGGSHALARVLAGYGTTVERATTLAATRDRTGVVLLTAPDDYSDAQLRTLAATTTLVALAPGTRATGVLLPGASPDPSQDPTDTPRCGLAGAVAAGRADLPADTRVYDLGSTGGTSCYGGAVVRRGSVTLLGSADPLRNDRLADDGLAALAVNLLSADRTATTVVWVLPGADAQGTGAASVWDLFPGGAYRAFLWLLLVGVLVVIWRARRLGGVVTEPLPVVVRAAELVEGHGRLYERAGARDRAADALRSAALARLGARLALPRSSSVEQVCAALAARVRRPSGEVYAVLAGPVPPDDAALVRLAADLDALERAADDPNGAPL